jgi:hypothetical protein
VFAPADHVEALAVVGHRLLDLGRIVEQRREAGAQRRPDPAPQFILRSPMRS